LGAQLAVAAGADLQLHLSTLGSGRFGLENPADSDDHCVDCAFGVHGLFALFGHIDEFPEDDSAFAVVADVGLH
jgi:hypothetical protein